VGSLLLIFLPLLNLELGIIALYLFLLSWLIDLSFLGICGLTVIFVLNCSNDFASTVPSPDAECAEVLDESIDATSTNSAKEWSNDHQLDKVMSRHLDGAVLGVRRLFNLVKLDKFEEMLLVHDELAEKEKETLHKSMDVVMYSRLMTRVRELGPQYVLPVFQRMLSVGVVPNVVPYTILVQAFMETVARVRVCISTSVCLALLCSWYNQVLIKLVRTGCIQPILRNGLTKLEY
jgi:hypothetical protein